jgi:hypothetical protein
MEQHLSAQRDHDAELDFNNSRMFFAFANAATLAINA